MLENIGKKAKAAERVLMTASTGVKNQALSNIAKALIENSAYIIEQNKTDIENARANGMSESMIDRLTLTEERIEG
ncbi:MAG: gamma-glutamyl-phosphate reductase, partial [Clostridia bacterium]|nr:gamma-glutamyl-phosphate reductase [Clostridia bacterium]